MFINEISEAVGAFNNIRCLEGRLVLENLLRN